MTRDSVDLRLPEAVHLAHAMVADVAEKRKIRALFIKGPVSEHYGFRAPRGSSDVDVLVDPTSFHDLVNALTSFGWVSRDLSAEPRILEWHSTSLYHPEWPCDIDVHHEYPGVLADREAVFDFMWRRRAVITVASRSLFAAGRIDAACIVALHALRDLQVPRNHMEYTYLINKLRPLTDSAITELTEFVEVAYAMHTLAPLLQDLGVTISSVPDDSAYRQHVREWELRSIDNSPTNRWISAIEKARWYQKPIVVFNALVLPGEMLDKRHPIGTGAFARTRARLQRLQRGLRALVPALFRRLMIASGKRDPR